MTLGDLQGFITEQEKMDDGEQQEREESPLIREFRGHLDINSQETGEHRKLKVTLSSSGFKYMRHRTVWLW